MCRQVGIKFHAEKCSLFSKEANFCGHIISAQGDQYHSRHFDSLLGIQKPIMAEELQQLLCTTNWMRNPIPAYVKVIVPLHALIGKAYSAAGKSTKLAVRKIPIATEWGAACDAAFDRIKSQLH